MSYLSGIGRFRLPATLLIQSLASKEARPQAGVGKLSIPHLTRNGRAALAELCSGAA
jgi:hypothetical protein